MDDVCLNYCYYTASVMIHIFAPLDINHMQLKTRANSQLHNHLVDSNALVVARKGSVPFVQQAAEKDKVVQPKLSNKVLHHNNSITITTTSIPINNFGGVCCSFKIVSPNNSASFL